MLVNKIEKWIDEEEEWFMDFLIDMTEDDRYGDELGGYDEIDFDPDSGDIWITNSYSTRCGDYDTFNANIPVEHVIRKLRKDKLDLIKNI